VDLRGGDDSLGGGDGDGSEEDDVSGDRSEEEVQPRDCASC
jgi:hypothetical protein